MLFRAGSYEALYDGFRWNLPEQLNMAAQVCDYWAGTAPDGRCHSARLGEEE